MSPLLRYTLKIDEARMFVGNMSAESVSVCKLNYCRDKNFARPNYKSDVSHRGLMAQPYAEDLLLVVLDNLGWLHSGLVGVVPKLPKCPALTQGIPASV